MMPPVTTGVTAAAFFVVASLIFSGCKSEPAGVDASLIHIAGPEESEDELNGPVMLWESDSVDVGLLAEGELIEVAFEFKNSGKAPLIISQVSTSCGCTAVKNWPRNPVEAGDEGTILISLKTRSITGSFLETASVVTNATPSAQTLILTGRVLGPNG